MHGKKKHCSHEVCSVVDQILNVNFVLAGSLQVRYKDTPDVQIVYSLTLKGDGLIYVCL